MRDKHCNLFFFQTVPFKGLGYCIEGSGKLQAYSLKAPKMDVLIQLSHCSLVEAIATPSLFSLGQHYPDFHCGGYWFLTLFSFMCLSIVIDGTLGILILLDISLSSLFIP
jgi:hypothetical protein